MSRRVRLITVCADCLCASCWHGEFMCSTSREASAELRKLGREHPYHYSRANVERVCGNSEWRDPTPTESPAP